MEKSVLEMISGEKQINPHYDIKAESTSCYPFNECRKMKNERKEELKDEMKNRISLALKDPILQQGFEIICKENAELRKFREFLAVGSKLNKGLISRNKFLEKERDKYRNMVFDKMEQHEDEVKLLKKENAKLKKEVLEVGQHLESTEMEWGKDTAKFIYYKTQLTKAKKLLAKWVELFKPKSNIALPIPIQVDTEQFLKEVENEEMAERYVNGIPIFAEEGEGFSRTQMQRAFLAGLKYTEE